MNDLMSLVSVIGNHSDRLSELIQVGVVKEIVRPIDGNVSPLAIVTITSEVETQGLRWLNTRTGTAATYWEPQPGEDVLIVCPFGDIESAIIIGSLNSRDNPPKVDASIDQSKLCRTDFLDGSYVLVDAAAKRVEINAVGTINVIAAGEVTLNAPTVHITGDVKIDGNCTAADFVTGSVPSYNSHKHPYTWTDGGGKSDTQPPK